MNGRSIIVAVLALAVALVVVRDAVVAAYASPDPQRAEFFWPGHPRVLVSSALTDIGVAAVKRRPPPPEALARIARAGRLTPLSVDPFLVRGISAQQSGDLRLAERAFVAARHRAPREAAPRYFLSELYVTTNRGAEGLAELATLARLLPNGSASVAPSLAAYARSSGDVANLKATFRSHPELGQAVLVELAKDPANADLALRLADRVRTTEGTPDWVKVMLPNLVQAGEFDRAYRLWSATSGAQSRGKIFDADFGGSPAPPPFNWTFRSDSAGFAELDAKGGLHVMFYGRDDAVLASQTLLLSPGRYRITTAGGGDAGGMLRWTVTCLPVRHEIAATAEPVLDFTIAAGCPAQLLELKGVARDMPKEANVTISGLKLSGGANAR